ncbi:peptidoglycan D,D-transpeptidase FtsI family protein [Leucobacter soli]|uniref:Penicillin-binding protein PbpB n=1 Tax=Leucobacter soli TaxID=2812850 RepID=A0A916JSD3_9MICO|nr:penicillin-binding protein 2 [Leucobacter soli]CAG7596911.1 Penicillin-binding protein PbpB [Leucobacter soli]
MPRLSTGSWRRLIAAVVVIGCTVVFTLRLVDIQLVSAAGLNEDAAGKRAVPVVIPSLRGDIVDRDGEILATTDERYDVQLSPKNTRLNDGIFQRYSEAEETWVGVTASEAFAEIGEITGQSAKKIQKIVDDALEENPKSDFAYVKRSVDLSALNRLKALEIPWLTFESNHARSYPNGAVGGNLVGFSGSDGEPLAGVELSQDACLVGTDGEESYERGADGVALPGSVVVTQEAIDGGTVGLTIDRDLQWEAQQIIDSQVASVKAEWGLLTIMDAKTGELVAVAEDDSVDPGDIDGSNPDKREARSFVAPYEPGSTFKTLTAAALIDAGVAGPTTVNATPDRWQPEPNVDFRDWFSHGTIDWTLTGILLQSSNVGISMLGSKLDADSRYDSLRKFGIGEATSAGMPAEDSGMLYAASDWDRQTSYTTMFGQGLSSTIVQTASAYQAIANDGVRIPPSLVTGCTDAAGETVEPDRGKPVQAVSKRTAKEVRNMLETVGTDGLVSQYVTIPGYRIGGKTGTAQQSNGRGGYRTDFVYSFAGMFPMDDPRYVIVSSVAFPKGGDGTVAATRAFHDAAEATIRTFHIPPSTGKYKKLATGGDD